MTEAVATVAVTIQTVKNAVTMAVGMIAVGVAMGMIAVGVAVEMAVAQMVVVEFVLYVLCACEGNERLLG